MNIKLLLYRRANKILEYTGEKVVILNVFQNEKEELEYHCENVCNVVLRRIDGFFYGTDQTILMIYVLNNQPLLEYCNVCDGYIHNSVKINILFKPKVKCIQIKKNKWLLEIKSEDIEIKFKYNSYSYSVLEQESIEEVNFVLWIESIIENPKKLYEILNIYNKI